MDSTTEDGLSADHEKQAFQPVVVALEKAHLDDHDDACSNGEGLLPVVDRDTHSSSSRAACGVVLQPIDIDDIIDRVMKADDELTIAQQSGSSSSIDVFKESIDVINLLNHTTGYSNVDILTTNSTDFIKPMLASSPNNDDHADSDGDEDVSNLYDTADILKPPYDKSLFETDSIESDVEGVDSDGNQRKILDLILTLQQRLQMQGDASDEWENDEDTGYMIIALAEEDFFELEEVMLCYVT